MNIKQKRFCEYYAGECCGNATQAALKAGYTDSYARKQSSKLLENKEVKDYIHQLTQSETDSNIATIEEIHAFWSAIFRDERQETKDRLRASELLAKCKGAFNNDW